MQPSGEVVHLLDLPSVEVEVDKTPEEPAAEPEETPGQGTSSPAKSSPDKMPTLPAPQVSHQHFNVKPGQPEFLWRVAIIRC